MSNGMTIIGLIAEADIIVKLVMLILVSASFVSWALIFEKLINLSKIAEKTYRFEKVFWSGQLLNQLYMRLKDKANHPFASIFIAAMSELEKHKLETIKNFNVLEGVKERIYRAMEISRNKNLGELEGKVSFLATIGSASPFIGLFGTVWGIMDSFQSIAVSKNTSLSIVAPGIAEALLATAIGLVAAIPAVIFYNIISNKISNYTNQMDNFISELYNLITKEIDNGASRWE